MAAEEYQVTFYDIEECGYYPYGSKTAAWENLSKTLQDLEQWVAGKPAGQTKTYDLRETEAGVTKTYLLDIHESNGDWLVALWNETANNAGQVPSLDLKSTVGKPAVTDNEVAEGTMPGYATYFWILPSKSKFASIKFQHPWLGTASFAKYIQSYMRWFCPLVQRNTTPAESDDEPTDLRVSGYRVGANGTTIKARPRFTWSITKCDTERDRILNQWSSITKILQKSELQLHVQAERNLWQKLLQHAHLSMPEVSAPSLKIEYELTTSPTKEDVQAIFEAFDKADDSDWSDYGFKIRGEAKPVWLRSTLAREKVTGNLQRENKEWVALKSLMQSLQSHRTDLLSRFE